METVEISEDTLREWRDIQKDIGERLVEEDKIDIDSIRYGLAMYVFYSKENGANGGIGYCVFDYTKDSKNIIERSHESINNNIPYMTGYLGFREVKFYKEIYNKVSKLYNIDVVIVNSYGKLHERQAGSATHLALEIEKPVIGVGSSLLPIDGIQEQRIKKQFKKECTDIGEYIELTGLSGKLYGAAVKTSEGSSNPLYVSVGNYLTLETCIEIVLNISRHRVPEPIRIAEAEAKSAVK